MFEEVDIFLVEDSASDAELIREALTECELPYRLEIVTDGERAIEYLKAQTERPHLMLLDLNLPKVGGMEVLKAVKRDPRLRVIPVVVLSNSTSQDEVLKCYCNFANAYLRKPVGFDSLVEAMRIVCSFWFQAVLLPRPYMYISPTSMLPPDSK